MNVDTVLILGATSDIAQAIAYAYAPVAKKLILAARKTEAIEPLAADLKIRHNIEVETKAFDALAFETHQAFANSLPDTLDTAVCVFGYLGEQREAEHDLDEALRIVQTNYTGAVSILSLIANQFEQRKSGTIIGISSVAGERGRQSNYLYGSSKAGFSMFLDGLRNRLYPAGVHVVTVKPGFVDTKMTAGMPLPKPLTAKPQQVAQAVFKAHQKKKNTVYVLWMWRYVMLIIRNVPEFIFKRMKL